MKNLVLAVVAGGALLAGCAGPATEPTATATVQQVALKPTATAPPTNTPVPSPTPTVGPADEACLRAGAEIPGGQNPTRYVTYGPASGCYDGLNDFLDDIGLTWEEFQPGVPITVWTQWPVDHDGKVVYPTATPTPLPPTATPIPTPRPGEGRHIWLNLYPEHYGVLQDGGTWLRFLDDFYEVLTDFVGTTPYEGKKIEIREVAPSNEYWAISGNPIKWNSDYVAGELGRINDCDVSWGIPHEISHDFDVWPSRQYYMGDIPALNAEQWANLKVLYAFERLSGSYPDATAYVGYCCRIPIEELCTNFVQQNAEPYISAGRTDWPEMNNDVFTGLLCMVKEQIGWEPFRQTFHDYRTRYFPRNVTRTDAGKVSLLVNLLSNHAGRDLSPMFQEWGFPITWVIPRQF